MQPVANRTLRSAEDLSRLRSVRQNSRSKRPCAVYVVQAEASYALRKETKRSHFCRGCVMCVMSNHDAKRKGLCTKCRKVKPAQGRTQCSSCATKQTKRRRARFACMTPRARTMLRARKREQEKTVRNRDIAAGRCVDCHELKKPADGERRQCATCREKVRTADWYVSRRKTLEPRVTKTPMQPTRPQTPSQPQTPTRRPMTTQEEEIGASP